MKVTPLSIPDVKLIEPTIHVDSRGHFFESFNHAVFEDIVGHSVNFVQDNQAQSYENVLRGLHYQVVNPQGKLVRVLSGSIYDVAVDLRESSPTFGKYVGCILSAGNNAQLWIPEGFAHGYYVMSSTADVLYKTTNYWTPSGERCILWNDSTIAIDWKKYTSMAFSNDLPTISAKDAAGSTFVDAEKFK